MKWGGADGSGVVGSRVVGSRVVGRRNERDQLMLYILNGYIGDFNLLILF